MTDISVDETGVFLTFDLGYKGSWALAERISVDRSGDLEVQDHEADAYLETTWRQKIAPRLSCRIDGAEVSLQRLSSRHEGLTADIGPLPFSLYYYLVARPPPGSIRPGSRHVVEIVDTVLRGEVPGKPIYRLLAQRPSAKAPLRISPRFLEPTGFEAEGDDYLLRGKRLRFELELTAASDSSTPSRTTFEGKEAKSRREQKRVTKSEGTNPMIETIRRRRALGPWALLAWLIGITLYGASHALTPGHGKSMVAAYLVGTQGRARDAVILGLTTTFTHTITIYIAALIIFSLAYVSSRSMASFQNLAVVAMGLLSGLMLAVLGLILFIRRFRKLRSTATAQQQHHHDEGHHHPHPPLFRGERPRVSELLALGFSGGLIPCPAGLATILIALHRPDDILFAFLLLVCFSLGLGGVLVAIGILLTSGKKWARGSSRDGAFFQEVRSLQKVFSPGFLALLDRGSARLVKVMPAYSCLFIAAVGVFVTLKTAVQGRTELMAIVRSIAGWLWY
jgi:ABC-type nickel/cobalt efflux system permease component RcnA